MASRWSGQSFLSVDAVVYRFELRRGDEIIATGHLSPPEPFEVGDSVTIGRRQGIVRSIEPLLNEHEWRLLIQVMRDQ